MRYALVTVYFVLGVVAIVVAVSAVATLPGAVARMRHEPEDVYILVLWAALATCLAAFWLGAAVHGAVGLPRRVASLLRVAAKLVVGLGVMFALSAPWAKLDAVLAVLLSATCLLSGLVVQWYLRHRGEGLHDV